MHKLKSVESKTLKLTTDDLLAFLDPNNPPQPEITGDVRQKQLNLIMAGIIAIRSYDTKPRRVSQELSDIVFDLRDAIEKMDDPSVASHSKKFCEQMTKEDIKTCPVPLECVKIMLVCLADLGVINPPRDISEDVKNTRLVLMSISENLSRQVSAQSEVVKKDDGQPVQEDKPKE